MRIREVKKWEKALAESKSVVSVWRKARID
jgi:hypothetical protein